MHLYYLRCPLPSPAPVQRSGGGIATASTLQTWPYAHTPLLPCTTSICIHCQPPRTLLPRVEAGLPQKSPLERVAIPCTQPLPDRCMDSNLTVIPPMWWLQRRHKMVYNLLHLNDSSLHRDISAWLLVLFMLGIHLIAVAYMPIFAVIPAMGCESRAILSLKRVYNAIPTIQQPYDT